MLSGCNIILVFVEGINDAALIYALLDVRKPIYTQRLSEAITELYLCLQVSSEERCMAIVGLGGRPEDREDRIEGLLRYLGYALEFLSPQICIAFIVDSDEKEPYDKARNIARLLNCEPIEGCKVSKRYYAKLLCKLRDLTVRIFVWRCTAECWIAMLAPGSSVASLDVCDGVTRRKCHEAIDGLLRGCEILERTEKVRHLIEESTEPWKTIIDGLRKAIEDGENQLFGLRGGLGKERGEMP